MPSGTGHQKEPALSLTDCYATLFMNFESAPVFLFYTSHWVQMMSEKSGRWTVAHKRVLVGTVVYKYRCHTGDYPSAFFQWLRPLRPYRTVDWTNLRSCGSGGIQAEDSVYLIKMMFSFWESIEMKISVYFLLFLNINYWKGNFLQTEFHN